MKKEFPEYLSEILLPTPSGTAKLLAAWDGLSCENQIRILLSFKDSHPYYLCEKIFRTALDSENSYIRYLAAKKFSLDNKKPEDQEIKKKIESDSSPLVKYSLRESSAFGSIFDETLENPEAFFSMPHEARLAKVRTLTGAGEKIAKLFTNTETYIKENKITEHEAYEILADYVGSLDFKKEYQPEQKFSFSGWGEHRKGKDVEELWKLTTMIPESISYPLLRALPESAGLWVDRLMPELLDKLNHRQLSTIFYRDNIHLMPFRKQVFFNPERPGMSKYAVDDLRVSACSHNFNLTHEEFASLLPNLNAIEKTDSGWKFKDDRDEKKLKILRDLGMMASDLSLVYFQAIHDFLLAVPGSAYEDAERPRQRLEYLIAEGKKKSFGIDIIEEIDLKLYFLAVKAVPWKKDGDKFEHYSLCPYGELHFLHEAIVEGDTWATFTAFSNKWRENQDSVTLKKFLPEIYGLNYGISDGDSIVVASNKHSEEIKNIGELIKKMHNHNYGLAYIIIGLLVWLLLR